MTLATLWMVVPKILGFRPHLFASEAILLLPTKILLIFAIKHRNELYPTPYAHSNVVIQILCNVHVIYATCM